MIDADQGVRHPPNWNIDYSLILLIHARQRNLINYQYHGPAWRNPPYIAPHAQALANLTCLQLFLQRPEDCDDAGVLIDRASRVRHLTIKIGDGFRRKLALHLHGRSRIQRLETVRALFGSVNLSTPRLGLESLTITYLPLGELAEALPATLPLQGLQHLQLYHCSLERELIRRLVQLRVNLSSYCLSSSSGQGLQEPNESLLELMTSPKRIVIRSLTPLVRNWATLSARSHALHTLEISDEDYDETDTHPVLHRSMADFFDFCVAAFSLEQLNMTCPAIESSRWEEPEGLAKMFVSVFNCCSMKQQPT